MHTPAFKLLMMVIFVAIASIWLGGCAAYYGSATVVAPAPYAYQYYYDPGMEVYYCYYPNYGWRYYPGMPPPNAVFWTGPRPMYLAPPPFGYVRVGLAPGIAIRSYYYFDPVRHVYYYRDRDNHWRYYPGRPPAQARFWNGAHPHALPMPPRGAAFHRPPAGWQRDHDQR